MEFFQTCIDQDSSRLQLQIEGLNTEQRRAVFHTNGPLLVIAGAGSGKTKVATLRIGALISHGVDPSSILGLTFTNKAAKEMKKRVQDLVGSSILISTFHSLGARILREFAHLLNYPASFVIYDQSDQEKLVKNCLRRLQADSIAPLVPPEEAIRMISSVKNSAYPALSKEIAEIFTLYQEELQKASAFDFDDLQYQLLKLLKMEEVQSILHQRWKYILVDEYQDTNDVQSEIASLLGGSHANIFAVGDPDQSIYSWRGANVGHILSFKEKFFEAEEIRLEKNYRSTNTILKASNAVIRNNQRRLEKNLWSDRGDGSPILVHVAHNERQEAEYVIRGIEGLVLDSKKSLSDIAILYRTNAQSRSFEDELIRHHVPYAIWGGLSFYQRREIKDVVSFARLSCLPQDSIAFERVINIPKRGIGPTTVEKLMRYASDTNRPVVHLVLDLVAADFCLATFPNLNLSCTAKQKKGLIEFTEVVRLMNHVKEKRSAFQLISSALHDTGYLDYLESEGEEYAERRENVEQLLAKAIEWDQESDAENVPLPISDFFEKIALETSVQESTKSEERITLATVHNAKGLEFSAVFLVGLEEDLFPHINVKWKKEESAEQDIEEERRLMYVGMTRAKDLLSLSLAKTRMLWGGFRTMKPSRFLYEVPEQFLQKVPRFPKQSIEPSYQNSSIEPEMRKSYQIGDVILHSSYGVGKIISVNSASSVGAIYEILFSADSSTRKIVGNSASFKLISPSKG
ncbi:MAG: 3'-5' exonuclease [Chlamydia sp.]